MDEIWLISSQIRLFLAVIWPLSHQLFLVKNKEKETWRNLGHPSVSRVSPSSSPSTKTRWRVQLPLSAVTRRILPHARRLSLALAVLSPACPQCVRSHAGDPDQIFAYSSRHLVDANAQRASRAPTTATCCLWHCIRFACSYIASRPRPLLVRCFASCLACLSCFVLCTLLFRCSFLCVRSLARSRPHTNAKYM